MGLKFTSVSDHSYVLNKHFYPMSLGMGKVRKRWLGREETQGYPCGGTDGENG